MLKSLMVALAGLGLSTMTMAAPLVEGQHYSTLDEPVKTHVEDGKIEVTEAFWYGCPHCYALEDTLNAWVDGLPDDVVFERMPATMGGAWNKHAAAFYAAKDLGIQQDLHSDFFDAIHEQGRQLTDPDEIATFFSDYGVSKDEALEALDSFGVKSQVNQAHARMRNMKLMGVPALIVDGRYVVTPSSAGSLDNMPRIAEDLVDKVREERAN
ncbi:thiol:disulfide interchange protein DsbA/DsbL [Halomonas elongata]|uniref:Thiol:disulfide interchange protein n=2 Tax=Halomonas elongata TaxID=2746 RepID=E1VBJ1_HALED|nr:thiol:disulfide interchange protein DsbA/DsbL [Halomonas elongata]MBW5800120.1 thiol:disulfide interchange protein DsbA/DsbL [Halomonas elongata]MDL4863173.1 thiol:disulfide interchange protein DsbA/DsbL [Halomonas elongata]OBX35538.1 thiol:disulfide interchange protein DsbA precursor [Halomonas elongata]RAW07212.1 thiol:disulfide interchange protein DsbA/DsbL [Halomonas elongata]WBF17913.1 thiol:disulfide interchange protein DsbA/DsbL [Halomonas elongata]